MDNKVIFNICPNNEFFGREGEIDKIYNHATSMPKQACGIYLAGRRWIGKTELLKRIYHRLFWDQDKIAPIYYRFKYGCTIEDFSADYIMDFIKQYNEATAGQKGQIIPALITVYEDKSFTFVTKLPPVSEMIKKKLNIQKGSGTAGREPIAKLTLQQTREIAEDKIKDLNAFNVEAAMKVVAGTARSMGVEIK